MGGNTRENTKILKQAIQHYLHIDVSGLYGQHKLDTGVACVSTDGAFQCGTTLSKELKKNLRKFVKDDFAQLHAIIIHLLLSKAPLEQYSGLVICNDADYNRICYFLDELFKNNAHYQKLNKYSVTKLREVLGNPDVNSLADGQAKSFRKRGLRIHQRIKEPSLNYLPVNFGYIKSKWKEK